MTERLMLLDTAALYFRAFYGVPDTVRAPDGKPVNAVRGLLDFIARLVTDYEPTHLVACWDDDWRPQWRVELIPSYKGHRVAREVPGGTDVEETPEGLVDQIPVIRETLAALGVAVVGAPGYEADDVIGTLATKASVPVDIVTSDRDLFQLIDDDAQVRLIYTARGMSRIELVTDAEVVSKYGITPRQYADLAVLRGDPSDGLPGVSGIGEKTAASLLAQYGDLAGVRATAADSSKPMSSSVRGKLLSASDYLDVAPRVVAVARDLDLGSVDSHIGSLDSDRVAAAKSVASRWGLGGSMDRALAALSGETRPQP